jgi:hypothetical protein
MSMAGYWWRAFAGRSWRAALATAVIGGLLGAVALGAVAGARRTATAYGRYLASVDASDAFVNVPGRAPGIPLARPITLISRLPGVVASAAYVGMDAFPVFRGKVDDSFQTNDLIGSYTGPSFTAAYLDQDRMTVLAGRLPAPGASSEIALTPRIAGKFGVGVGGRVTYLFSNAGDPGDPAARPVRRTFLVTAIVDVPPVLVDQSDQVNAAVLPPGATRQLLAYSQYAWIGVRLARGTAGIRALQDELAALATRVERQILLATHHKVSGLTFNVRNLAIVRGQVQQAIRPQAVALAIFGAIAALAMLVLVGQGMAQLLSRSAADMSAVRTLGATRAQAALAASLPCGVAIAGSAIIAVAGAVALSPLAPVGPVRVFDPARGVRADGLVLGAGCAALTAALTALLALMAARATRPPADPGERRPSATARAAAAAGLPATAVVGSRNALEPGAGLRAVPVRAILLGSVAAVTAVTAAVVFGTSLTSLIRHPARYGWNWNVLIQAEGGYGNFRPAAMTKLIDGQPAVAGWSDFAFSPLLFDDSAVVPVLGVQQVAGSVEPPTTSGRPISGNDQVELGTVTLRALGKHIGDTVLVGSKRYQRPFTIVGTVTLPSFGLSLADHVSLGSGAMMSERALLAAQGLSPGQAPAPGQTSQAAPSAVAIDLVPGTSAVQQARLIRHITSANPDGTPGGTYQLTRYRAAAIDNPAQMGQQPLTLALSLAAAATASLALTVLTAVRRRRRELALLKTLGMTRRQIRAIVAWQASSTLVIATAVGVPVGIAAGNWAWTSFANSLGVAPVTVVSGLGLGLGIAALLATGNLLAVMPAAVAANTPAADTLRAE